MAYHGGLRASEFEKPELRDYYPKTDRILVHRLKGSNFGEHHLMREEALGAPSLAQGARILSGSHLILSKQKRPIDVPPSIC